MEYSDLGTVVRELAPDVGAGNPRNSEGAFCETKEGKTLPAYSRFRGKDAADHSFADIWIMESHDRGRTFEEGRLVLSCEGEGGVNMMSPSFLEMQNGDIGLFYLVRMTYTRTRVYFRRSADGGKTFGERVLCTPQEDFFVVNNDRVVRLKSGRIIIPAASHRTDESFFDSRSEVLFFCSDDDGESWKVSEGKCALPYSAHCRSGLQEPGVVELSSGVVWAFARTELGRQFEMFSMDQGMNWTACQPSGFTAPNSPLCMKRGFSGELYAVWNPIPEFNGRKFVEGVFTGGRTPLVIAASADEGASFTDPIAFEWDEERGYCYCAIFFTEDALLLAYCAGGKEDGSCLARTRIRRIEKKTLLEKGLIKGGRV